jgi:hypothetical protein
MVQTDLLLRLDFFGAVQRKFTILSQTAAGAKRSNKIAVTANCLIEYP